MTPTSSLPVCSALWIGPSLGPLERACLASFVEVGHAVHLYAYDDLVGTPPGVEVRDAATVLPREAVAAHRAAGKLTLVANHFRYALQRLGLGVWIDCDLLCLRPLPDGPFVFGRQDERRLNNAVLRLPPDHPILADLLAMFERPRWVPPWARLRHRIAYAARYRLQPTFGIADMRWGTTGPGALTYYAARHGLTDRAQPADVFYPVSLRDADALLSRAPGAVRAHVTERTCCIHLWNRALGEQDGPPPAGSFVRAVLDGTWRSLLAERPARPLVSVVVPTYREAANLPLLVPRVAAAMTSAALDWEMLVVDDDSADGTTEACGALAARFPLRLVVRRGERGLASAVVAGFGEAAGDTLVVMDADLSHPPEAIPALVAAVREGRADLAIGSRYVAGASTDERWGVLRRLNSWLATRLAGPLTHATDPMSGFFALTRATLASAAPLHPVGYKIGLELSVKCGCRNIVDVPIHFADRAHGTSKLGGREQLRYLRHLGRLYAFRLARAGGAARRAVVAVAGATVDLGAFALLLRVQPFAPARALAVAAAAACHLALERRIRRADPAASAQAGAPGAVGRAWVGGGLVNFGTSVGLAAAFEGLAGRPLAAAAVGVAAGTAVAVALLARAVPQDVAPAGVQPSRGVGTGAIR